MPGKQTDIRTRLLLAMLALAVLWFASLGTRRLLDPDEGRYAEISREMISAGDWLTPRLNGLKYFEKPPLQYWATAAAFKLLGETEFAARLWVGLTGFAGILLAFFAGQRLFNLKAGWMAACVLASSLMYVVVGHIVTLDIALSFFLQLAMTAFLFAQQAPLASTSERRWMLVAWCATALGFLSKGLVAGILPALTLMAYSAVTRDFSAWRRLHVVPGLLLFLAISAPWVIAVSMANHEFPGFFFLHEHFQRFFTDVHHRAGPWWYFIPLLIIGVLPWSFVVMHVVKRSWRADAVVNEGAASSFQPRRFLILWIVTVMAFFSLSHSKLPPYIVPALPAIALLLGEGLQNLRIRLLQRHFLGIAVFTLLLSLAIALLPSRLAGSGSIDLVNMLRASTASSFALMTLSLIAAVWILKRGKLVSAVTLTTLGTLGGLVLIIHASDAIGTTRSGYDLARQIAAHTRPEDPLYSLRTYDETLPFYLKRTMTLVEYRGELDFGLTQEPRLGVKTLDEFIARWQQQTRACAVMPQWVHEILLKEGLPMKTIATQGDMLAVARS